VFSRTDPHDGLPGWEHAGLRRGAPARGRSGSGCPRVREGIGPTALQQTGRGKWAHRGNRAGSRIDSRFRKRTVVLPRLRISRPRAQLPVASALRRGLGGGANTSMRSGCKLPGSDSAPQSSQTDRFHDAGGSTRGTHVPAPPIRGGGIHNLQMMRAEGCLRPAQRPPARPARGLTIVRFAPAPQTSRRAVVRRRRAAAPKPIATGKKGGRRSSSTTSCSSVGRPGSRCSDGGRASFEAGLSLTQ